MAGIGTSNPPLTIGVMPLSGFALMSYAATVEPFRAANLFSRQKLYDTIVVGIDDTPVESSGAAFIRPQATIRDQIAYDYLFVVAGGDPSGFSDNRVFNWLGRQSRAGVCIGGVSGGPIILARAGLMNGRRMTVHWEHAAALAEVSPHLAIERSLFVIDRDRVTCAGGTAPLDLMHALIAADHGELFAGKISDWFLHTNIRPSVGPQRRGLVARVGTTNPAILSAVEAMENHIADPLTLPQLAVIAAVSPRQLNRLFKEKINSTTVGYYQALRLDMAQNLLRNSTLSLTEIALATGFANSSHFSRNFAAWFHHTPSSVR